MTAAAIRALVVAHLQAAEGLRLKPYRCPAGKLTIGYGRNLDANGISPSEAALLLAHDVEGAEAAIARHLPWVARLDGVRQAAVVELVFNLGLAGFLKFDRTIVALHEGRYGDAAAHLLESRWAGQVGPRRSGRIARMVETGRVDAEEAV